MKKTNTLLFPSNAINDVQTTSVPRK